jgi:hypothetical protein
MVKITHLYECNVCGAVKQEGTTYVEGWDVPKPHPPEGWRWVKGQIICGKHRVTTLIDGEEV